MAILDTDILIPYLRNDSKIKTKITELLEKGTILETTSINVAELYLGAYLSNKVKDNLYAVDQLISKLKILYFEGIHGKIYGKMRAELQKKGDLINELDIFIASIALDYDSKLITRNIKHFEKINGLKVEKW